MMFGGMFPLIVALYLGGWITRDEYERASIWLLQMGLAMFGLIVFFWLASGALLFLLPAPP